MTAAPPRRRKETRPTELLDAALEVFAEKGFAAARMEEIAARAGAAKGTIYLYFPSKQAVFEALVRQSLLPNIARFEAMVSVHDGPAAPLLRRVLEALSTLVQTNPGLAAFPRLIVAEARNFPDLARFYRTNVIDRGLGLLASIHRRGVATGEFRDQDSIAVARLCLAPFLMIALWRSAFTGADADGLDPTVVASTHIDTLLRGLAAEAPPEESPR